jgi:MFS family permease
MAIGLALWSSMTAMSGFAQSFGMLATARIGVGIGEASASPAAYSMIADYFPKERRATALSIYSSGLYIGGGIALPIGGYVLAEWGRRFPDALSAPLGLAPWQAAFLAVGLPGLVLAAWIWSLREPLRGAIDGHPSDIVRPNAWSEFGRELAAILPPLTLISAARLGVLVPNLIVLAVCAAGAFALATLTGDWPQWIAWWTGIYAIFSWTQSLKRRDPATHRLLWGTPMVVTLTIAFGSISFMTYAVAFWIPPYVLRTFYTGPTDAAMIMQGVTAAEEVSTIFGWSAAAASAIGVILG